MGQTAKDKLHLDVALTSTYQYYDINGLTFFVDGKLFYTPAGKTEQSILTV